MVGVVWVVQRISLLREEGEEELGRSWEDELEGEVADIGMGNQAWPLPTL